jgi:hypothetical protein
MQACVHTPQMHASPAGHESVQPARKCVSLLSLVVIPQADPSPAASQQPATSLAILDVMLVFIFGFLLLFARDTHAPVDRHAVIAVRQWILIVVVFDVLPELG